jgi:hypothetical protein
MITDLRFAFRKLLKSPGFTSVVVITLALGIGANAAIFTLVRGVLIKPLVNRDEDRLIYIRQSAPGAGTENSTWSMPEIGDLKARIKSFSEFGDFSTISFTMIGLGEPREVSEHPTHSTRARVECRRTISDTSSRPRHVRARAS